MKYVLRVKYFYANAKLFSNGGVINDKPPLDKTYVSV